MRSIVSHRSPDDFFFDTASKVPAIGNLIDVSYPQYVTFSATIAGDDDGSNNLKAPSLEKSAGGDQIFNGAADGAVADGIEEGRGSRRTQQFGASAEGSESSSSSSSAAAAAAAPSTKDDEAACVVKERVVELAATLRGPSGVRLKNCELNVGQSKYAFNALQVQALPQVLRPPTGTFGASQS